MRALAIAALLCAACGGHGDPGDCALRNGTYVAQWAIRSGNCGAIPGQLLTFSQTSPGAAAPQSPCWGNEQVSGDNCKVTSDTACTVTSGPNLGGTAEQKGVVTWSTDAARGSGIVDYILYDVHGNQVCEGTYDFTATRQ
jgi:hypothetical protein